MGARIPEHVVREVLSRVSIVDVVGEVVRLQGRGDRHVGLCPFHKEKTPSFQVVASRGFYHCFGCKASGDAARFLMEHDGLSFPEAVKKLADRVGIAVEYEEEDRAQDAQAREARRAYERAMEGAQRYWEHVLWSEGGRTAQAYLTARGVDEATARRFGLGYAPPGWTGLVDVALRKVALETLEAAGLARPGQHGAYDVFRDRVMFPIYNVSRKVVAFSGRALAEDAQAKYYNSPETEYFRKGKELYGLHVAHQGIRRRGEVVLVEGNFDVVTMHAAGLDHVVAALGTALTTDQVRLLRRFAERVVLMYDGDAAGKKAARRALDVLLSAGVTDVGLVVLGTGEDPDSVVRAEGGEAMAERIAGARPMLDVCVDGIVRQALEDGSPSALTRAARRVAELLTPLGDEVMRAGYVEQASRRLGVRPDAFVAAPQPVARDEEPAQVVVRGPEVALTRDELVLVEVLDRSPTLLDRVAREQLDGLVPGEAFGAFLGDVAQRWAEGAAVGLREALRAVPSDDPLHRALGAALVAERTLPDDGLTDAFEDVVMRWKKSWCEREMRRLADQLRDAGDPAARAAISARLGDVQRLYRDLLPSMRVRVT